MNNNNLVSITLERKELAKRKLAKDKGLENYSWVLFFAGEEFDKKLTEIQEEKDNIIDFGNLTNDQGGIIEEKIKKICYNNKNQQLINRGKFPIIWFKNIKKIKNNSPLEKSLLSVFDPQQNMKLFGDEKINLSNFILVATSSINSMGELSLPLISRLDCVNVETAQPKKFFLNEYYSWILFSSFFLIIILLTAIFWSSKKKN
ncbi:MAG: Lon protease [Mycoplasmataceae bacterium]|nr:MAG: Lon protease [Mycoplasmataceae bacterium]